MSSANEDQQALLEFMTMAPPLPPAPVLRVPLLLAFLVPPGMAGGSFQQQT